MIAYYELTKQLYDYLQSDEDINTVLIGNIDEIDTNKVTMFPLAHILVGAVTPYNGFLRFSVTISTMDVIDIKKNDPTKGDWKGNDNKQNLLNTMLAVQENLVRYIQKGAMYDAGYSIEGLPSITPFEDRFENLLTGWSSTITIDVPNNVQKC